jgi:Rrf2 family protein
MSEAASIAIHTTLWLAQQPARLARSTEVCRLFGFSEAHFAKVMQALSRAGLVESVRGPRGGSRLAKPPAGISLLEVYEALDGPFLEDRCLLSPRICTTRCCPLGREITKLNRGLRQTLSGATLETMAGATDWSGLTGSPDTALFKTKTTKTKTTKTNKTATT